MSKWEKQVAPSYRTSKKRMQHFRRSQTRIRTKVPAGQVKALSLRAALPSIKKQIMPEVNRLFRNSVRSLLKKVMPIVIYREKKTISPSMVHQGLKSMGGTVYGSTKVKCGTPKARSSLRSKVHYYNTGRCHIISKTVAHKIIRQIAFKLQPMTPWRFNKDAIMLIQDWGERQVVDILNAAGDLTAHKKRKRTGSDSLYLSENLYKRWNPKLI